MGIGIADIPVGIHETGGHFQLLIEGIRVQAQSQNVFVHFLVVFFTHRFGEVLCQLSQFAEFHNQYLHTVLVYVYFIMDLQDLQCILQI